MKRVSIEIDALIEILQAMQETGQTTHVIVTDYDGWPAFVDKDEPENMIVIQGEEDEEDTVH